VDLSLHKVTAVPGKYLSPATLFGLPAVTQKLLMDVNKRRERVDDFARAQFTAT
jgi:hypothetical protein